MNIGDLPQSWVAGPADDVTCSEPILASLESATSVARSYGGQEFTDGRRFSVESDSFVYLSAEDAREAWLAVSSRAYADCVIGEARREARARGTQFAPPEVSESPISATDDRVVAVRLVQSPPGETGSIVVDRVWIQRASALVALRLTGESEPFDAGLAEALVTAVAARAERAAVTRESLQQTSPSQPPAESIAARASSSLVDTSDLPPGWVKARNADPVRSLCSNELLRNLGSKPLVVYGDSHVPETGAAVVVDSIVYMFSTEHEARWGLETLAGEGYLDCVARGGGSSESAADVSFRDVPSAGLGDHSRAGQLVAGVAGDERVIASKVWIQQGTLIGGIGLTAAGNGVDAELTRDVAERMAQRLAP